MRGGESMTITDVKVKKVQASGRLRAIASITIDDMFAIHDMKVIAGDEGLFIAMPNRKTPSGEYRDIAHPINSQARHMLQTAILTAYDTTANESEGS